MCPPKILLANPRIDDCVLPPASARSIEEPLTVLIAHAWNAKVGLLDNTLAHEAAVGANCQGACGT